MSGFELAIMFLSILGIYVVIYIIGCIRYFYVFKALEVNKWLAFVPLYNTYRLYKEYKGRVWKKNWGVMYLIVISLIVLIIFSFIMQQFIWTPNINNIELENILFFSILVGVLFALAMIVVSITLGIVLDWPLLYRSWHKVVYIILLIAPTVLNVIFNPIVMSNKVTAVYGNLSLVVPLVTLIFNIYISYMVFRQVKKGKYKVVEKYDPKKMTMREFKIKIATSEHCLIEKVEIALQSEQKMEQTIIEKTYV